MLNTANKNLINAAKRSFATHTRAKPGIISQVLNTVDKHTTAFQVAKSDPSLPLEVSSNFYISFLIVNLCAIFFDLRVINLSSHMKFKLNTT